jgi:hypothetical protein
MMRTVLSNGDRVLIISDASGNQTAMCDGFGGGTELEMRAIDDYFCSVVMGWRALST